MIVRGFQIDDHVRLRLVITDALNETATRRVAALECFQIDRATIFYVNGFRITSTTNNRTKSAAMALVTLTPTLLARIQVRLPRQADFQ
jgi:hypothetical protein